MFIAYWYLYMIVLSEIWLIPFPTEREPGNTGALHGKFTLPLLHLQQPQLLCLSITKQDPEIVINPSTLSFRHNQSADDTHSKLRTPDSDISPMSAEGSNL